jgi:NAD(P)H dehydrogenase (quinone)
LGFPEKENAMAKVLVAPTRFGNMAGQMRNFLDQTGGLWASGALVGNGGSMFTCSATQHGDRKAPSALVVLHGARGWARAAHEPT